MATAGMGDRLHNIDTLKCVAAFLVVCIHVTIVDYGVAAKAVARVAVPLFLVISGWFWPRLRQRGAQWRYLKKIVWLTVVANVFYIVVNKWVFHADATLSTDALLNVLVLNAGIPGSGYHLWYFSALIYTVLIAIALGDRLKRLYVLIPLLFVATYAISSLTTNIYAYRNFLFLSLPYFLLGCCLWDNKERVDSALRGVSVGRWVLLLGAELVLLFAEICAYRYFGLPAYRDHYLMTTPMVVTLFLGAACVWRDRKIRGISNIGRTCSTYIYILHVFVIYVLHEALYNTAHIDFVNMQYVCAMVTFVVTAGLACLLKKLGL